LAANWRRTTAPLSAISAAMKVSLIAPLLAYAPASSALSQYSP
jgi:hypothetical protein